MTMHQDICNDDYKMTAKRHLDFGLYSRSKLRFLVTRLQTDKNLEDPIGPKGYYDEGKSFYVKLILVG